MEKLSRRHSSVIIVLLIIVVGIIGFGSWNLLQSRSGDSNKQSSNSNQQAEADKYLTFQTVNTKNWKEVSKSFASLKSPLKYKYPRDWSLEAADGNGHPNYATLTSPDKKSCIKFSVSAESSDNIDDAIKNAINNFKASDTGPEFGASTDFPSNNRPTKIVRITKDDKKLLAAGINLIRDKRDPSRTVFALLTTCSQSEGDVLNAAVQSVSTKP